MEAICRQALVVVCLFLGACDDSGQHLQCSDPALTSECQRILRACEADAAAPAKTAMAPSGASRLASCLKRTYADRCNAACQVAE